MESVLKRLMDADTGRVRAGRVRFDLWSVPPIMDLLSAHLNGDDSTCEEIGAEVANEATHQFVIDPLKADR